MLPFAPALVDDALSSGETTIMRPTKTSGVDPVIVDSQAAGIDSLSASFQQAWRTAKAAGASSRTGANARRCKGPGAHTLAEKALRRDPPV
jgi:hypothetical protein